MPTAELRWPFRDRLLDITWGLFGVANLLAMIAFPSWETVPFHFIWVSLTVVYGFRVWRTQATIWTLVAVIVLTGLTVGHDVAEGLQPADELTEVPLMAAMFVAMVWHARRRLVAMQELELVSETNRQLLEREKRFTQDASHQLRTPITIALGHAQLIERNSDGRTAEDAHVVVEELQLLRRLADTLLAMAAGEEAQPVQMRRVDVDVMVADTLRRWMTTQRVWRIDDLDEATVLADPDQLQLALDALIDNAVGHTDDADAITLGVRRRHGSVVITVADTGVGIEERDLGRIFERFARSTSDGHANRRGLGLGLAFVKSVAESHGGSVRASSSSGRGSTFELSLPAFADVSEDGLAPAATGWSDARAMPGRAS